MRSRSQRGFGEVNGGEAAGVEAGGTGDRDAPPSMGRGREM